MEWTATLVEGVTIINIYKPPSFRLQANPLPIFSAPCIYAGDFNEAHSGLFSGKILQYMHEQGFDEALKELHITTRTWYVPLVL